MSISRPPSLPNNLCLPDDNALAEARSILGTPHIARAPLPDELFLSNTKRLLTRLSSFLWDGKDAFALSLLHEHPQLARGGFLTRAQNGPDSSLTRPVPLSVLAADHCCFQSARFMLEHGAGPLWLGDSSHTVLGAAALGVGQHSSHRLLDAWNPDRLMEARCAFIGWLTSREADFHLLGEGLCSRTLFDAPPVFSHDVLFLSSLSESSFSGAIAPTQISTLLRCIGRPSLSFSYPSWHSLFWLCATRPPRYDTEAPERLAALIETATVAELGRAQAVAKRQKSPCLPTLLAAYEARLIARSAKIGKHAGVQSVRL